MIRLSIASDISNFGKLDPKGVPKARTQRVETREPWCVNRRNDRASELGFTLGPATPSHAELSMTNVGEHGKPPILNRKGAWSLPSVLLRWLLG